jgi:hypothetical protein
VIKISRRSLLRGVGGAAIALPFLNAMGAPSARAGGGIPKRLVVFFSGNGTIADRFEPTGGESDFELSYILEPLAAHRSKLLIPRGIDMVSAMENSGAMNGHDAGMGHMLVARPVLPGPSGYGEFGHVWDGSAGGISLDQEAARHLSAGTRFGSLELGVKTGIRQPVPGHMSWRAPFEPALPTNDPGQVFDRLFGGGDAAARAARDARRASVLDAVRGEYESMAPRLGADDRRRLDSHLTSIRNVERRLTVSARACSPPSRADEGNFPTTGRLQMDLLVSALSCGLTNVGSLQWSTGQSGTTFSWLGHDRYHHDLSHDGDSNVASQQMLADIQRWYAGEFAYLLDQMDSVMEADGQSLLDHSIVLWANELGKGNDHTYTDIPYVIAGGASGALRTGRYVRFPASAAAAHGEFFVTLLQALGIEATTFGDPAYCRGALSGLLA